MVGVYEKVGGFGKYIKVGDRLWWLRFLEKLVRDCVLEIKGDCLRFGYI